MCLHIALFVHPKSQTPYMNKPEAAFFSAQIHPLILPCRSPCFGSCCAQIPPPSQSMSTSLQTCHHFYNLLCQQNCKQAAWPVWITKQFSSELEAARQLRAQQTLLMTTTNVSCFMECHSLIPHYFCVSRKKYQDSTLYFHVHNQKTFDSHISQMLWEWELAGV